MSKEFEVKFENLISNITEARCLLRKGDFAKADDVLSYEDKRQQQEKIQMLEEYNELLNRLSYKTLTEKDIIYYMNMHGIYSMNFCNLELHKIEIATLKFRIIVDLSNGEQMYFQDYLDFYYKNINILKVDYKTMYLEVLRDLNVIDKDSNLNVDSKLFRDIIESLDRDKVNKILDIVSNKSYLEKESV